MYFSPYIDGNGVHIPTYEDRLEALVSAYRRIFGAEICLEPSAPDYQLLSVFAKALDDLSQIILVDFASRNPLYASGVALDLLMPLFGLSRGGATYSTAALTLRGTPGAVLPAAPEALDDSGYIWACQTAGIQLNESGEALVTAVCATPGAVAAPAGSIRRLVSPIPGLFSAVNAAAAVPGTEAETDASCRRRMRIAAAGTGVGTLEAIRSAVLSVPNVSACKICENDGDETDARGIPGHSLCVLFSGGNAAAVAQAVFNKKAPGIGTCGTLAQRVTDAWGGEHTVRLQRITNASVALTVEIRPLTGYAAGTADAVKAALAAYGNGLAVGQELVVSSLVPVCYGAVPSAAPTFSVSLLTATCGETTTSDVLPAVWNQRYLIRENMITVIESA